MRRFLALAAVLVCALPAAGCGGDQPAAPPQTQPPRVEDPPLPVVCTEIGCGSGLTVIATSVPAGATVRVCAGRCESEQSRGDDPLSIRLPLEKSLTVDVRVTARQDGATIAKASGTFEVQTLQPNGPRCEPTCYVADLQFDARDEILRSRIGDEPPEGEGL